MKMQRTCLQHFRGARLAGSSGPTAVLGRSFHASASRFGAASSSFSNDEYVTHESFGTPFWRNIFLFSIGAVVLYRFSVVHAEPHPSRASSSGRSAPDNKSNDDHRDEATDDNRPFLTRYIEGWMTPSEVLKERSARQFALIKEAAERKLFLQDAERPPVHRLRFPQTFQQFSPHSRPVGATADLSDLNIKRIDE